MEQLLLRDAGEHVGSFPAGRNPLRREEFHGVARLPLPVSARTSRRERDRLFELSSRQALSGGGTIKRGSARGRSRGRCADGSHDLQERSPVDLAVLCWHGFHPSCMLPKQVAEPFGRVQIPVQIPKSFPRADAQRCFSSTFKLKPGALPRSGTPPPRLGRLRRPLRPAPLSQGAVLYLKSG